MSLHDVVVVGSCNMDLIATMSRMPKVGETVHGDDFVEGFGGKGANQAVAAALLGARVGFVGKVGEDTNGDRYRSRFEEVGIDTARLLRTGAAPTGVAPIFVDADGNNCIVIVGGANMLLTADEVGSGTLPEGRVLVTQNEVPLATTAAALRAGKERGMLTVFNSAPAPERGADLDEALAHTDVVCPNETEAEAMTGLAVATEEEAAACARAILERGPRTVVLTLGARGAIVVTKDADSDDGVRVVRVACPEASKVVDTVGAGDCFVGTMALRLSRGDPVIEAVRTAVRVASVSVGKRGVQTSFPAITDLPADLQAAVGADRASP